jgi:NADH dehydrogenase FAD-containing subunit
MIAMGCKVTVISASASYCYSGMAPGVLAGHYARNDITKDVGRLVESRGARFIEARVTRVDAEEQRLTLSNGEEECYDVVSFNIGSYVPLAGLELDEIRTVVAKPISNFLNMRDRAEDLIGAGGPIRLLVVGGGPAGLEISSNLADLVTRRGARATITLVAGSRLMSMLPAKAIRIVRESLAAAGIEVVEGVQVSRMREGCAFLGDGERIEFDLAVVATGVRPETLFRDSGLPVARDGGLLVNRRLQCVDHPEILAAGDCASFCDRPLPRIGVVACRQNSVIYRNLVAFVRGKQGRPFHPRRSYLQIFNLGGGRGLMCRGRLYWCGKLPFRLKDKIDRRFMRRLGRAIA